MSIRRITVPEKETPTCPFEYIADPQLEADKIALVSNLTRRLLDKRYPTPKKILRGVHPKAHGCVKACFKINADIESALQVGIFESPNKEYNAVVRFSNASARVGPDISDIGEHGSRGIAIKLFDIENDVLLENEGKCNQDFLLINQTVFAFANTDDYLRLMQILVKNNDNPAAFFAPLSLKDPILSTERKQKIIDYIDAENLNDDDTRRIKKTLEIVTKIKSTATANPLNIQYFSAAPFLFGQDKVMKFSVKPIKHVKPTTLSHNPSPNYLHDALVESMAQSTDIIFDFMVQIRDDRNDMDIENASSEWNEDKFPFINVATLTLHAPQELVDEETCESLVFTPWHSRPEHQPIGSINRLRKDVYQTSANHREQHKEEKTCFFKRLLSFFCSKNTGE